MAEDTITAAPAQPQAPAPVAAPAASNTNTSHPATASAPPAAEEEVTSADTPSTPRFNFNEQHWAWKSGLRVFTIIVAIIGIGTLGWSAANAKKFPSGDWLDGESLGFFIIPLAVSLIFNLTVQLILFLRRTPIHPGVCVGIDLILWLSLIVTGLFTVAAAYDLKFYGYADPYYYTDSSDNDSYYDSYYYYYGSSSSSGDYIYDPSTGRTIYQPAGAACSGWDSCAQERAVIAALAHRATIEFVAAGATFLCLLLHFVLFVWACVDTHRHNADKTSGKARVLAERIVSEMVESGRLVQPQQAVLRGGEAEAGRQRLLAPLPAIREGEERKVEEV